MSAEIYAAKTNRNWSDNERNLSAYLAREYQYKSRGARDSYKFLTTNWSSGPIEREYFSPERTRPWLGASVLTTILFALRLRRPDREGE